MTFGDAKQTDSGQHNSVGGDLLVLLSGLCYAAYTVSSWILLPPLMGYLSCLEPLSAWLSNEGMQLQAVRTHYHRWILLVSKML